MKSTSLSEKPEYEALSYCWGEPGRQQTISINGTDVPVFRNLHQALVRLRATRPRTLWIDAICINQQDVGEKEYQVPMIRDIYRSCRRVLVWLGEHDRHTRGAFQAIEFLSSQIGLGLECNLSSWKTLRRGGQPSLLDRPRVFFETLQSNLEIGSIAQRPWFQRAWVVQEIALSPSALVICGKFQIDWREIERASRFSDEPLITPHVEELIDARRSQLNLDRVSFLAALCAVRVAKSTDPRDKIYAGLGLCNIPSELERYSKLVNYVSSPAAVAVKITRTYLETTSDLEILIYCRGYLDCASPTQPSWSFQLEVDWTRQPNQCYFGKSTNGKMCQFRAGGKERPRPTFSADAALFCLKCQPLDVVAGVSDIFSANPFLAESIRSTLPIMKEDVGLFRSYCDARRLYHLDNRALYPFTGQTLWDAFCHCFLEAHQGGVPEFESREDKARKRLVLQRFDELATWMASIQHASVVRFSCLWVRKFFRDIEGDSTEITEALVPASAALNRRFLVTKGGYIGWEPAETVVGDRIVLIQGAASPFVVRPVGYRWRFVGECFVHGVMFGESFSEALCEQMWFE